MVCQNSYRLPLIYKDKYERILKFAKLRMERFVKQYRLLVFKVPYRSSKGQSFVD